MKKQLKVGKNKVVKKILMNFYLLIKQNIDFNKQKEEILKDNKNQLKKKNNLFKVK